MNLYNEDFMKQYVKKGFEVYGKWSTLAPSVRANTLIGELNGFLTNSLQIPALKTNMGANLDAGTCGQLDFSTWTVQLNFQLWSQRSISLETMGNYSVTIYHETRHAEQWYRVGQGVAAGQFVPPGMGAVKRFGPTAAQIALSLSLPDWIARDLEGKKRYFRAHVDGKTLKVETVEGWFESIYGTDAAHRNAVLASNTVKAYISYRHLPEEADAYKVEQSVRAIWKQNEPDEGLLDGVSDLFTPKTEVVHFQEWVSKTSRDAPHFRSSELHTLDRALQTFDGRQTPANRQSLLLAFDTWYKRNPKEAAARNKDNCVQRLKSFLEEAA